ncbi:MAG: UDP-N-acetylglucosamine 1-carboxyvinyltransferase [Bacillota bacterium]|nr:UDP-N-acetylglucosamine 1-carboxyvinyltransferase [Bacillota bacterium]
MHWMEVRTGAALRGSICVPGSKNSALALLSACCLTESPITLSNVPDISDVRLLCEIEEEIGLHIEERGSTFLLDPKGIFCSDINLEKSASYRASYYFVGALLARFKKVTVGYPGGDDFGSRPIDQHIKGLEALGARFTFNRNGYTVEAEKLRGTTIYFDVITSGATINVMLAAILADGRTVLGNAARDPEVVDTAILLQKMGAKIRGAGTNVITIDGVEKLKGCTHSVIPDRLVAASFLIAAGVTGGDITVENIIPEHLLSCTAKLEEAGLGFEVGADYIRAFKYGEFKGINVKTAMYPGFPSDLQQPLTAMLVGARGHSTITDTVYPWRYNHCPQLNKMGADIIIRDNQFVVPGNRKLSGTWVHASDVRAGICLILAGLCAQGTTYITGVEHIERGYENVAEAFISLGADISICSDTSEMEA